MPEYNYDTLLVNSRPVQLNAVLKQSVSPGSEFERDSFLFIREWFGDTSFFHFQTSGSTGTPKQITFSREQLMASARATIQALELSPGETSLICLNTKFVAGKMMLVRSFINQMKIILIEPSSNPLEKINPDTTVDFMALAPIQVHTMLECNMEDQLNKIRNIIVGGAPVSDGMKRLIKEKLLTNVYATYGMTETITHIALEKISFNEDDFYNTLPGVTIQADERNCLVISTAYLQETVTTNDVVEIVSPQRFRWIGRWDNVINTGGVKVIPEVLEEKLTGIFRRLNIHRRYFIAGLPDATLGSRVVLFIEGEPLTPRWEEKVTKEIINDFLKFEIPRQIIVLKQFNDTATGKINRHDTLKQL